MRLTLRTLLAYLDDTLDAAEIKQIGQKVAESEAAQELIGRIKQVTRRRRLTAPPSTGPGARFDPNDIAEYLDNTLPSEKVAEVEKTCLESDVHLAEIAACHQILTLVLGEPALVPPTAKQRMYGLVQGREAIPYRKAPVPARAGGDGAAAAAEEEDEALLGLPSVGGQGAWLRWVLPLTVLCLLAALVVVIVQTIGTSRPTSTLIAQVLHTAPENAAGPPAPPPSRREEPVGSTGKEGPPASTREQAPAPPSPPADNPQGLGQVVLVNRLPNLLLRRQAGQGAWQRLLPEKGVVSANDTLLALPGYRSEVKLNNGVSLLLWGSVPQFNFGLLESSVVLNPPGDADLDLYLERGRILLRNQKPGGKAVVRVHFNEEKPKPAEVWEITLEDPDAEVALDLFGRPDPVPLDLSGRAGAPARKDYPPFAELYLAVLQGQAHVKIGYETRLLKGPPGRPSVIAWENKRSGVWMPGESLLPVWDKALPATQGAQDMQVALGELLKRPSDKPIEVVLAESLQAESALPANRYLAVLCLGAVDALPKVLDALADEDERHGDMRTAAVLALQQWVGRRADHEEKLGGLLLHDKNYTPGQAETMLQLLHGLPPQQMFSEPQTWAVLIDFLKHDKPAIRQLAYYQLVGTLTRGDPNHDLPEVRNPVYNPAGDSKQRDVAYDAWKKLIPDGKRPPPPQGTPSGTKPPPK